MPPEQWECTMVRAIEAGLPRSLGMAARALGLPEDKQKDVHGKQLINLFCKPVTPSLLNYGSIWNGPQSHPEEWQEFMEYCRQDVVVEAAIRRCTPNIDPAEQRLWEIDQEINDRGVLIDRRLAENACMINDVLRGNLMTRAQEITGLSNPNSRAQMLSWINSKSRRQYTTLRKDDLPVILEETKSEEIREVIYIRSQLAKASVAKFEAMLTGANFDGRARGLTRFYGAEATGRWSGQRIQLQNLKRNNMSDAELDAARALVEGGSAYNFIYAYSDPADTLGQLVRTALIPKSGCRFIVSDFSAIEARVLAWLAGEEWRLEVFRSGGMLYDRERPGWPLVPLMMF